MKTNHEDPRVIELLDTCIRCAQELVHEVGEQRRAGMHSSEAVKCLTDALACLCRCQDYFKADGEY